MKRWLRIFFSHTYENLLFRKNHILSTYRSKPVAEGVYASMTTYLGRIDAFEYAILSLLAGSMLPEKILVYIPLGFRQELDKRDSLLGEHLYDGIVELIEMEVDYFCHSKYFYAFQSFGKDKDIVLFDDDVVYYKDWLNGLYEQAQKSPGYQVFAYKAVEVTTHQGTIAPYDDWVHCNRSHTAEGKPLYTEAVGGVFYKKGFLLNEIFNKDVFLEVCPKADDVWLWFCTHYNNGRVKFVPTSGNKKLQYIIPSSQDVALWKENTFGKRNDQYVADCYAYFCKEKNFDILTDPKHSI